MPSEMAARIARCPQCGKPRDPEFRPFCSRGCRDRDLIKWFGEDYRVASNDPPDGAIEGAEDSVD